MIFNSITKDLCEDFPETNYTDFYNSLLVKYIDEHPYDEQPQQQNKFKINNKHKSVNVSDVSSVIKTSKDISDQKSGCIIVNKINPELLLVVKEVTSGFWGFPKGHRQLHKFIYKNFAQCFAKNTAKNSAKKTVKIVEETFKECAIREVFEETNLKINIADLSDEKKITIMKSEFFIVDKYENDVIIDKNEIADYKWITVADLAGSNISNATRKIVAKLQILKHLLIYEPAVIIPPIVVPNIENNNTYNSANTIIVKNKFIEKLLSTNIENAHQNIPPQNTEQNKIKKINPNAAPFIPQGHINQRGLIIPRVKKCETNSKFIYKRKEEFAEDLIKLNNHLNDQQFNSIISDYLIKDKEINWSELHNIWFN